MANVNRLFGFRPAKSINGSSWNAMIRKLPAADRSADSVNNHGDLYVGDPIKISAGKVLPANSNDTVLGVVVGIGANGGFGINNMSDPNNLLKQHLTFSESGDVWYVPADGVIFEVVTATALSLSAGVKADTNVVAATAHGSRTTSASSAQLVTAVNNDVIVVEDDTSPDNDTTLINAKHLVKFLKTVNGI